MLERNSDMASLYFSNVIDTLRTVLSAEKDNIIKAGHVLADCVSKGRVVHVFGSGHSHILAEECYYRAGGLVRIDPILDSGLMLHESPIKSTLFERMEGYAEIVLSDRDLKPDDVMVVCSQSGINPVPVEVAQIAKQKGLFVVAITSLSHSRKAVARTKSGLKLYEVCDLVIDNHVPYGDASITMDRFCNPIAPLSTVIGATILNAAIAVAVERMIKMGYTPEMFISSNIESHSKTDPNQAYHRLFVRSVRASKDNA